MDAAILIPIFFNALAWRGSMQKPSGTLDKFFSWGNLARTTKPMLRQKMFVLLPSLFAAAQVFAVSVYEPFSYPAGSDLAGQGGWVLTAGTTSPKVQAGTLAVPGLMPATDGNSLVFGNRQMEVRRFMKNEDDFFTPGVGEYEGQY